VPCTLGLALLLSGCAYMEDMFRQKPQALLPAQDLYQAGEQDMSKKYYPQARTNFQKIDMGKWPNIQAYMGRVAARPKVQEALKAEGLVK